MGRDIEPLLSHFPGALQDWYRQLNVEAQMLNAEERCLRYAYRTLSRLLDQFAKRLSRPTARSTRMRGKASRAR